MRRSCESRWFFPVEIFGVPDRISSRFGASNPGVERVDRYLLWPETSTVGVKWRGGEQAVFEVKALVCSSRPRTFGPGASGLVDEWVKWSVSDAQLRAIEPIFAGAGTWAPIRKMRFLRYFRADGDRPVEMPNPAPSGGGCDVELTAIEILGQSRHPYWCSLGFEAYGTERVSLLDSAVADFFASESDFWSEALISALPVSYPTWLAMAVQPGG